MPFICICCLAFVCVEQVDCSGTAYEFHLRLLLCWRNLSEPTAVWYNPCRAAPASATIAHTYSHKPRVTPDLGCTASEEMGGVMWLARRPFVHTPILLQDSMKSSNKDVSLNMRRLGVFLLTSPSSQECKHANVPRQGFTLTPLPTCSRHTHQVL